MESEFDIDDDDDIHWGAFGSDDNYFVNDFFGSVIIHLNFDNTDYHYKI